MSYWSKHDISYERDLHKRRAEYGIYSEVAGLPVFNLATHFLLIIEVWQVKLVHLGTQLGK
jgi:hypothetical protein